MAKENKGKTQFQRHFRKFHDKTTTSHPQYVYGDDGKRYKVLGITSSPETDGIINMKLEVNPEPGNTKTAYIRTKPGTVNKGVRNKKLKGWKLAKADKPKVQEIIDKAEKKPRK